MRVMQLTVGLDFKNSYFPVCILIRCIIFDDNYVKVDDELEIKAYYAGHVLGAAMFHIKVGSQTVVYTVSSTKTRSITQYIPK